MSGITSGSLVMDGANTLTVTTNNSYSGGTTLNAGRLNITTNSALGSGTLTLNGGTFDNTSSPATTLTLPNNPQIWGGNFAFNGTNPINMGTGAVTLTGNRTITVNGTGSLTVGGVIGDGNLGFGFTKAGPGTLLLGTAAETYIGATTISGGTVVVAGSLNGPNAVGAGQLTVGNVLNTNGILDINGGTVNATKVTSPSIAVGNLAGSQGFINMSSGAINTSSELHVGNAAGGTTNFAALTMTGGTITSGSWFVLGSTGDRAILNQTGGSITVSTNRMTIAAGNVNSVATYNLSGASSSYTSTSATGGMFVGEFGTGTLNLSNGATLNVATNGLVLGNNPSANGTVNFGSGTISTNLVARGNTSATATFNFHGGTLKAIAANANFMTGLNNAYIWNEGATIDNGGFNVGVGQALLAPIASSSGVTSISVTGGSGYVDTPIVQVTGGTLATGGAAASAVASINYTTGAITGIAITNPGSYTVAPTGLTFIGGGTAAVAPTLPVFGTNANSGGGLTLVGAGVTTLSGASSYSGTTIDNLGGINVNNATALGAGTFTLNSGTIDNTSASGAIIMTANNPQNWNTDVTFIGTNSLNMGTGAVTINATRTVTTTANTLSVGGINQSAAGFGLIKAGAARSALTA